MSHFQQMRNGYATTQIGAPTGVGRWVAVKICPFSQETLHAAWIRHGSPAQFQITSYGIAYMFRPSNGGKTFVCYMWTTAPAAIKVSGVDVGVGAHAALPNPNNRLEISAADDLLAYFDTNPCTQARVPVVAAFQNAYNASSLPGRLTVDGQYGGNTQRALQNTLDEAQNDAGAGPSQQAPVNCFGMAVPVTPTPDVAPTPAPVVIVPPATNTTTNTTTTTATPWGTIALVAAAVTGVGLVGYAVAKKKGFSVRHMTGHGHRALHHRYA
jgi:hypothetical protein